MNPFPYKFIAIEGNIGAGKTSLCQMMKRDFQCRLILEQFTDNPFLPFFYKNPERYAFPVELFFMTERHKQLQESLTQQDLFQELIVSDYFFIKTLLFAKNNLSGEEYRLFQRLFHILNANFPKPELLVYLHRPVDDLLKNIRQRGRGFEKQISPEYLSALQTAYFDFFKTVTDFPVLILDIEGIDFWNKENFHVQILDSMKDKYQPGVHKASVSKATTFFKP